MRWSVEMQTSEMHFTFHFPLFIGGWRDLITIIVIITNKNYGIIK